MLLYLNIDVILLIKQKISYSLVEKSTSDEILSKVSVDFPRDIDDGETTKFAKEATAKYFKYVLYEFTEMTGIPLSMTENRGKEKDVWDKENGITKRSESSKTITSTKNSQESVKRRKAAGKEFTVVSLLPGNNSITDVDTFLSKFTSPCCHCGNEVVDSETGNFVCIASGKRICANSNCFRTNGITGNDLSDDDWILEIEKLYPTYSMPSSLKFLAHRVCKNCEFNKANEIAENSISSETILHLPKSIEENCDLTNDLFTQVDSFLEKRSDNISDKQGEMTQVDSLLEKRSFDDIMSSNVEE